MKMGRKRNDSDSNRDMAHISRGFVPTASFVAVPKTPPPIHGPRIPDDMGLNLSSTLLSTSLVGRLMHTGQDAVEDEVAFSDPDSSAYDYAHMNKAGYSSVEFGTLQHRRGLLPNVPAERDQDVVMRRPVDENMLVAQERISDIYAVPHKRRNNEPAVEEEVFVATRVDESQSAALEHYLIDDAYSTVPVDRSRSSAVIMGASDAAVRDAMKNVIQYSPPSAKERKSRSNEQEEQLRKTVAQMKQKQDLCVGDQEVMMELEKQLEQASSARHAASILSDPHDDDVTRTAILRKQVQELQEENKTLKSGTHRLSIELSKYQAKYRPVSYNTDEQSRDIVGLPSKGPIPSWLINIKYLAPLFLAYDDQLKEKENIIKKYQERMSSFQARVEQIIDENTHLKEHTGNGAPDDNQWKQMREHARIVLEENQVLLEQIDVQQNKTQDMCKIHNKQVTELSRKIVLLESERSELDQALQTTQQQYTCLKTKRDSSLIINTVDKDAEIEQLERKLTEGSQVHNKEMETMNMKLKAVQVEHHDLAIEVADLTAQNKELDTELKLYHKNFKKLQTKMLLLKKVIELSESKELTAQQHLASIVKLAEKTSFERDTYARVAHDQEGQTRKVTDKLLQGNKAMGKLEEKLKMYKLRAAAKICSVADQLNEQDKSWHSRKQEYEREVKHLRLLLKEKEETLLHAALDRKDLNEEMELMWQAANSENQRMKDSLYRSLRKKHVQQSDLVPADLDESAVDDILAA